MIQPLTPTTRQPSTRQPSTRRAARPLVRPEVAPAPFSEPARVSPARLPAASDLGWGMVNLGLLTLLAGVVVRLLA